MGTDTEISIRKAKRKGYKSVMDFFRIVLKDYEEPEKGKKPASVRIREMFHKSNHHYFIAESNGKIIATAGYISYYKRERKSAYLTLLGVYPKMRGKGIATHFRK